MHILDTFSCLQVQSIDVACFHESVHVFQLKQEAFKYILCKRIAVIIEPIWQNAKICGIVRLSGTNDIARHNIFHYHFH